MFKDEVDLKPGVTLKVYRFLVKDPKLSMMVRLVGDSTEKSAPIIAKHRQKERLDKQAAVQEYEASHPETWYKGRTEEERKHLALLRAYAEGDSLMDLDGAHGEALLAEILLQLQEVGLKVQSRDRRSNGELDEEIIHLA